MTYTELAIVGVIVAALVDVLILRTNLLRHKAFWAAYAIIACFQLITNGVLTGLPVVRYDPAGIIGWRLAFAPVEDLLFGFAMIVVTLSVWVRLGARPGVESATPRARQ